MSKLGIVLIGRNEGDRFRACLDSLEEHQGPIVYVDSGSQDNSVSLAKDRGVIVVELDPTQPFTAARARNEGVQRLSSLYTDIDYVQFVDGDCAVDSSWLAKGMDALDADSTLAVVSGRRRERFPEATIYNRWADIEWNTPVGEATACHGDAMMRLSAYNDVGGFDPTLIAGEEPELCVRLRHQGWRIERLESEMTIHDADIHQFSAWWKRMVRSGHAQIEGFVYHGLGPSGHEFVALRSTLLFSLVIPLAFLVAACYQPWALVGIPIVYFVQWMRIVRNSRWRAQGHAMSYAFILLVGKFAQLQGILKYISRRLTGRRSRLIEYKGHPTVQAE